MKFLADMGISPRTVTFLRNIGHDTIHLHDENLDRLGDPDILEKARSERRVLLTHDLGFGELVAASEAALPSVITFRLRDMSPSNVNHHLQIIIIRHAQELEQGSVISVTETRLRARLLPLFRGDS